ncbi:MAG: hypothetical protein RR877_00145 [Aurantimicrobium sp.]|uniref:hypothetical protein n=1 Tax=Aurantimicrobium sp. TaxID=1930784 RepID=UPI002FC7F82C
MATLPVKWFDWRFHGLPGLSGTPGSLSTILDAVLVNGFGDTKVVTINVLNKKATFILQDGVKFFKKSVIKITGFTNQALNGEYRVDESDTGKLTITLDVPDGQLENTNINILVKYAPLGWFKPFSGVSRGIYKPSPADALKWMFYIDDTTAQTAEVRIMENATSLDNHIAGRPYNNTLRWMKAYNANTTVRPWSIIGDGYCFYFKCSSMNNANEISAGGETLQQGCVMFVGEGVRLSNKPDPFAIYLTGQQNKGSLSSYVGDIFAAYTGTIYALRHASGAKTDASILTTARGGTGPWQGFDNSYFYTDDNVVQLFTDNYFYGNDRRMTKIPGVVTCNSFRRYDTFDFFCEAKDNNMSRDLIFMRSSTTHYPYNTSDRGYFFDITGPWR